MKTLTRPHSTLPYPYLYTYTQPITIHTHTRINTHTHTNRQAQKLETPAERSGGLLTLRSRPRAEPEKGIPQRQRGGHSDRERIPERNIQAIITEFTEKAVNGQRSTDGLADGQNSAERTRTRYDTIRYDGKPSAVENECVCTCGGPGRLRFRFSDEIIKKLKLLRPLQIAGQVNLASVEIEVITKLFWQTVQREREDNRVSMPVVLFCFAPGASGVNCKPSAWPLTWAALWPSNLFLTISLYGHSNMFFLLLFFDSLDAKSKEHKMVINAADGLLVTFSGRHKLAAARNLHSTVSHSFGPHF